MTDLFKNFSLTEIILCVIGILVVIDWIIKFKNSVKAEFDKSLQEKEHDNYVNTEFKRRSEIQDGIAESVSEIKDSIKAINNRIDINTDRLGNVCNSTERLEDNIALLTDNNKVVIKAHISEAHTKAMKEGYITQYDLEICERMYENYCRNHGEQLFIKNFMEDLRKLPNEKK